jgi:hypothetical protein
MMPMAALVSLQALLRGIINTWASKPQHRVTHFSMAVVYLSFLRHVSIFDLRAKWRDIRWSQKGLRRLNEHSFRDLICKVADA